MTEEREKVMSLSTFYVDVENLQTAAKQAITAAIEQWPGDIPKPDRLILFAQADQCGLWQIWAGHGLPFIETKVVGVQHYTQNGSKNSADIALALNALADLLKGRTQNVSILSDDSDFAILFAAIKEEASLTDESRVPFRWFMTDREGTRSAMLGEFFPPEYVQFVACPEQSHDDKSPAQGKTERHHNENETIARFLIQSLPVGPFKSGECKKLILKNFPQCSFAKADSATFGNHFSKSIWPILETYKVELPNPNRKPRKYEMTEAAKDLVRTGIQ